MKLGFGKKDQPQEGQPKETIEFGSLELGIIKTFGGADLTPFKDVQVRIAEAGVSEDMRDAVWGEIRESRSRHQSTQGIERGT